MTSDPKFKKLLAGKLNWNLRIRALFGFPIQLTPSSANPEGHSRTQYEYSNSPLVNSGGLFKYPTSHLKHLEKSSEELQSAQPS